MAIMMAARQIGDENGLYGMVASIAPYLASGGVGSLSNHLGISRQAVLRRIVCLSRALNKAGYNGASLLACVRRKPSEINFCDLYGKDEMEVVFKIDSLV